MIDGTSVTGLRTAAASALATQMLARPEAKTLGIFGAGLQAETHVDAITAVRPIESVLIWARNHDAAVTFAEQQSKRTGLSVKAVGDPADAAASDIMIPVQEGAIDMGHIIGEIGQVASDDLAGRLDDKQITLYKSLGITAQDLVSSAFVYRRFLSLNSHSD